MQSILVDLRLEADYLEVGRASIGIVIEEITAEWDLLTKIT